MPHAIKAIRKDRGNLGRVTRYGPSTDPTLDAHRDNDFQTEWYAPSRREPNYARRLLVIAVVAAVVFAVLMATGTVTGEW